MSANPLLVILGNQLFPRSELQAVRGMPVFMAEDRGLCTHFTYHKHKLILFLASMRAHADDLRKGGFEVEYHELSVASTPAAYEENLEAVVRRRKITELVTFEVEDKFFEKRLTEFCRQQQLGRRVLPSPMFLTSRQEFGAYLARSRKPFMRTFYEQQRRKLNILMEPSGEPVGGQFSFDADNRKPLPKGIDPPEPSEVTVTATVREVAQLVDELFASHPGYSADFWLPTTRRQALAWLDDFLEHRLQLFGPYEDALAQKSTFVFHSVISPLINLGLLTPAEIIDKALATSRQLQTPLASLEGFVRQVIGWREFIRGIYQNFSEIQEKKNFWSHRRLLTDAWYAGNTGIPVLDHAIAKVNRYGWCHHIERLMVISNLMLLCEVHPREAHRWFMEMFVDSSDWVMGPNVYGMGLFSDGGIFATKPYICGSNYYLKMSGLPRGPWCDVVDGLYWSFVEKHQDFFARNPRTSVMTLGLRRLSPERKEMLFGAAEKFRKSVTKTSR